VCLQYGQLCKACTADKCHDPPSKHSPALLLCISCNGSGCAACSGRGRFAIDDCPHKLIDRTTGEALRAARFAEKGVLPVAGGTLDQTQSCLDALDIIWSDQAYWKGKLGIIG
jgi:hypothetical protein